MKQPGGNCVARPPEPVHAFFALFLAKPDDKALRRFCIDLLDLEVRRVKFNVFLIPPLLEASERYKSGIDADPATRRLHSLRHWCVFAAWGAFFLVPFGGMIFVFWLYLFA